MVAFLVDAYAHETDPYELWAWGQVSLEISAAAIGGMREVVSVARAQARLRDVRAIALFV